VPRCSHLKIVCFYTLTQHKSSYRPPYIEPIIIILQLRYNSGIEIINTNYFRQRSATQLPSPISSPQLNCLWWISRQIGSRRQLLAIHDGSDGPLCSLPTNEIWVITILNLAPCFIEIVFKGYLIKMNFVIKSRPTSSMFNIMIMHGSWMAVVYVMLQYSVVACLLDLLFTEWCVRIGDLYVHELYSPFV